MPGLQTDYASDGPKSGPDLLLERGEALVHWSRSRWGFGRRLKHIYADDQRLFLRLLLASQCAMSIVIILGSPNLPRRNFSATHALVARDSWYLGPSCDDPCDSPTLSLYTVPLLCASCSSSGHVWTQLQVFFPGVGTPHNSSKFLEAIAFFLEAIAITLEAIPSRWEAIAIRLEDIAIRLQAIAIR